MTEEMTLLAQQQRRRKQGQQSATTTGAPPAGGNPTTLPVPAVPAREAPAPQPSARLYSIFALQHDRGFAGAFNARGTTYKFQFNPIAAAVENNKLVLTGDFTVSKAAGASRTVPNVKATLISTQGGVSGSPERRQLQMGTTGTANVATPDQKQEQAKSPETQPQAVKPGAAPASQQLVIDATGKLGFVGVMFFRLQPLDSGALGVPVEMRSVQFNARLLPENDLERDLLWLYSDTVTAGYDAKPDAKRFADLTQQLNNILQNKA